MMCRQSPIIGTFDLANLFLYIVQDGLFFGAFLRFITSLFVLGDEEIIQLLGSRPGQ